MPIDIKKKQRPADQPPVQPPAQPPSGQGTAKPPRRSRRRLYIAGGVLLAVLLFVGLLPTIVAHTLLGSILRRTAKLDGTLSYRSASLGWFSSTAIKGIAVRDAQNGTVLEVDSVTCNRSLLRLMFNSANLGTLRIEKPRLNAKLTRDGSNIETVLARWLGGPSGGARGGSGGGVDLTLEVADGEATVTDAETQQAWHVTNLQLAMDLSRRLAWPARIEGSVAVDDRGHAGSLSVKSHLKPTDTPPPDPAGWSGLAGTDGDLNVQASALPLAMFQRLAARGLSPWAGMAMDGALDVQRLGTMDRSGQREARRQRHRRQPGHRLAGPGERCHPPRPRQATCHVVRQDRQLTIDNTQVECDVGNITTAGHIDLGDRGLTSPADLLPQRDGTIQGTLDLARLAHLLPGTLRLRPGTEITSGQVQLTIRAAEGTVPISSATAPAKEMGPSPFRLRPGGPAWSRASLRPSLAGGGSSGTSRLPSIWRSTRQTKAR